jgi:arsenite methyltransferase
VETKDREIVPSEIRKQVRKRYGQFATQFQPSAADGCCGAGVGETSSQQEQVMQMYDTPDVAALPADVTGMALGCGDPVTLASLQPGQTVLDLGSGGGIDCFLAAQRVGETGRVIGVDMTASMIEKARANQVKVGADNVEFRLGEIEHLPVADSSVDVIISNCVINLSPDKPQVFREAFRALKPGGLLAVSDIMSDGPLAEAVKNMVAWSGCVGGALEENQYIAAIEAAGFVDVQLTREYPDDEMVDSQLAELGIKENVRDGRHAIVMAGDHVEVIELDESDIACANTRTFSGKIKARKPAI